MMMSVDQTFETGAPFLNEVLLKYALDNNHVNINTNANDLSCHQKDKKKTSAIKHETGFCTYFSRRKLCYLFTLSLWIGNLQCILCNAYCAMNIVHWSFYIDIVYRTLHIVDSKLSIGNCPFHIVGIFLVVCTL